MKKIGWWGVNAMKQVSARNPAMDVVRCFALLCVNAVHFFGYTDLYWKPTEGIDMWFYTVIRTGLMICVPLFIILSGYLSGKKELSKGYYKGILKTFLMYVLASLFTIAAYYVFCGIFYRERESITGQLLGIFSFTTIPYAWYMEMYFGLFLLIPFLNILFNHLPGQKEKQFLLLVLVVMTALPSVVNVYNLRDAAWWKMPSSSEQYNPLLPAFWVDLYPVTYYYIGCYLREYPVKMKKRTNILLFALVMIVGGTYTFYRSYGSNFVWGIWQDIESLFFMAEAVLAFIFLAQRDYRFLGARARSLLAKASGLCFGGYLVSWIVQEYVYMIPLQFDVQVRYWQGPLLVPVVYVVSLAISAGLNGIYGALASLAGKRGRAV